MWEYNGQKARKVSPKMVGVVDVYILTDVLFQVGGRGGVEEVFSTWGKVGYTYYTSTWWVYDSTDCL